MERGRNLALYNLLWALFLFFLDGRPRSDGPVRHATHAPEACAMPQSFNWPAIRVTARVLLRQPSLALPHLEVGTIADVDFRGLRALGCRGVVFDKDNTLTAPYVDTLEPSLRAALDEARTAFDGKVAVLSNSAGTPDDPGYEQAERVERALGVPVLRRPAKKPEGFDAVRTHFGADTDPSTLVMVGDRYLTDVTFGNLHGMLCVRTRLLTHTGDNRVARMMRPLENLLVALFRRLCFQPTAHRLAAAAARSCVRRPPTATPPQPLSPLPSPPPRAADIRMCADPPPSPPPSSSGASSPPPPSVRAGSRMLSQSTWAVVGDVLHPRKPARAVAEHLEAAGKTVHRVNPRDRTGTLAQSLRGLGDDVAIDVVDLIINPKVSALSSVPPVTRPLLHTSLARPPHLTAVGATWQVGLGIVGEMAEMGVKAVYIQPGAGSADIEELCEREGIEVHHGCVLREL